MSLAARPPPFPSSVSPAPQQISRSHWRSTVATNDDELDELEIRYAREQSIARGKAVKVPTMRGQLAAIDDYARKTDAVFDESDEDVDGDEHDDDDDANSESSTGSMTHTLLETERKRYQERARAAAAERASQADELSAFERLEYEVTSSPAATDRKWRGRVGDELHSHEVNDSMDASEDSSSDGDAPGHANVSLSFGDSRTWGDLHEVGMPSSAPGTPAKQRGKGIVRLDDADDLDGRNCAVYELTAANNSHRSGYEYSRLMESSVLSIRLDDDEEKQRKSGDGHNNVASMAAHTLPAPREASGKGKPGASTITSKKLPQETEQLFKSKLEVCRGEIKTFDYALIIVLISLTGTRKGDGAVPHIKRPASCAARRTRVGSAAVPCG